MATQEINGDAHTNLQATYGSATGSNTFTKSVSTTESVETTSKAAHLKSIRAATKSLQEDINSFLTSKMEEDKLAVANSTATTNGGGKNKSHDDVEEEENYGEEKIEDD